MNAPKILNSLTTTSCEILPMTPNSEVSPDPQKIDHFFQESVERQKNNKTVKTKMNTMTVLEQIESYFKVEFSKMTNDQLKQYITAIVRYKESLSGLDKSRLYNYIFMCMRHEKDGIETLNKADASIIFNSVAPSKLKKSGKALTITCSTCGKTGHNKSNEKFHPIVVVVKDNEDDNDSIASDDEDDGFENCEYCGYIHHYEDKCPNETTCEHYEKINEDDLDIIVIKGGATEPIPIVKIKPCVEQTPIEKPIVKDSNYDAVVSELKQVLKLDKAVGLKYIRQICMFELKDYIARRFTNVFLPHNYYGGIFVTKWVVPLHPKVRSYYTYLTEGFPLPQLNGHLKSLGQYDAQNYSGYMREPFIKDYYHRATGKTETPSKEEYEAFMNERIVYLGKGMTRRFKIRSLINEKEHLRTEFHRIPVRVCIKKLDYSKTPRDFYSPLNIKRFDNETKKTSNKGLKAIHAWSYFNDDGEEDKKSGGWEFGGIKIDDIVELCRINGFKEEKGKKYQYGDYAQFYMKL